MFEFKPADIVLVHSTGFNGLRLITGMYFNHALLIDERFESENDYGALESIAKGPAFTCLSNYIGEEVAVYRWKAGLSEEEQDQIRYEARRMGTFKYDYLIFFKVLKRIGIKEGVKQIIRLWSKQFPLQVPVIDDSAIVCSEFAQESYAHAGKPLEDNGWLLTPDAIAWIADNDGRIEEVFHGKLTA